MLTQICIFVSPHLPQRMERIDCDNSLSRSRHSEQMQLHQGVGATSGFKIKISAYGSHVETWTLVSQ